MKDATETAQKSAVNESDVTAAVDKALEYDNDSLRGKRKYNRQNDYNKVDMFAVLTSLAVEIRNSNMEQ